jgi:hypothetical protein
MPQKCTIPILLAFLALFNQESHGGGMQCSLLSISTSLALAATTASPKKKSATRTRKTDAPQEKKPSKRYVTIAEVESRNFYSSIESYLYRICIKEVPFFLALYNTYCKDARLNRSDTLVLTKNVLSALLVTASHRLSTSELTVSPVLNIDSIMIFRPKGKRGGTTRCGMIIYTVPGAYEIPKTGARITVPPILRGTVSQNAKTRSMSVTVLSRGVKLQLPGYAKLLSLGIITDMDVRYAELLPADNGFEARLMYASQGTAAKKKGWSFNVTECNKIRPYAR